MDEKPRRHWFRFRQRTLLVVANVILFLAMLGVTLVLDYQGVRAGDNGQAFDFLIYEPFDFACLAPFIAANVVAATWYCRQARYAVSTGILTVVAVAAVSFTEWIAAFLILATFHSSIGGGF